ncbi:unnamed protein product [Closterium sp. Naga37s-1]|nr:unnamed protein product [Closterium sp. Naga37s-1]
MGGSIGKNIASVHGVSEPSEVLTARCSRGHSCCFTNTSSLPASLHPHPTTTPPPLPPPPSPSHHSPSQQPTEAESGRGSAGSMGGHGVSQATEAAACLILLSSPSFPLPSPRYSNLQKLNLGGAVPAAWAGMVSLKHFVANAARMRGRFPSVLLKLPRIADIVLYNNFLWGALPPAAQLFTLFPHLPSPHLPPISPPSSSPLIPPISILSSNLLILSNNFLWGPLPPAAQLFTLSPLSSLSPSPPSSSPLLPSPAFSTTTSSLHAFPPIFPFPVSPLIFSPPPLTSILYNNLLWGSLPPDSQLFMLCPLSSLSPSPPSSSPLIPLTSILYNNFLWGPLPPAAQLFAPKALTHLTGPHTAPPAAQLFAPKALTHLDVSGNYLSGAVPKVPGNRQIDFK